LITQEVLEIVEERMKDDDETISLKTVLHLEVFLGGLS
jgi:hypothetical protein